MLAPTEQGVKPRACRTALQAAEKSESSVIPSGARDLSWFECPQKEGFLVASFLGMTAILIFSAASLAARPFRHQLQANGCYLTRATASCSATRRLPYCGDEARMDRPRGLRRPCWRCVCG